MKHKRSRWLLLALVIASYTFMYTQSDRYACDDDCKKVESLNNALVSGRTYIYSIGRCGVSRVSDTLCLLVKDTAAMDWNLLADTACLMATQNSLYHQKLFIITYDTVTQRLDTLLKKQCP
jgi:hypothetical protein